MTLIECFTGSPIDNIVACLRLRPRKLVFVGDAEEMRPSLQRYRKVLQRRGLPTEITLCDIGGADLKGICAALRQLLAAQEDCVIDLTGGDELVIMAVGAVMAGLDGNSRIRVQKFDPATETVLDCLRGNQPVPGERVCLCVEELIALHGGSLHPSGGWSPTDLDAAQLDRLWQLVAEDPKQWNRSVALLNEFESKSDSRDRICLPVQTLRSRVNNYREKEPEVLALLKKLSQAGAIEDRSTAAALEYRYCGPLFRYCTQKAGNVLEVKTLLEGRDLQENGVPFFEDCRMSVGIDWDGVVHSASQRVPETRNEIDVVLVRGVTPLFISCKNGSIGEEELYKLHTVATRFAGPCARKMLIATDLDQKSAAADRSLAQRARDMNIFLVPDAAELTRQAWQALLTEAMK